MYPDYLLSYWHLREIGVPALFALLRAKQLEAVGLVVRDSGVHEVGGSWMLLDGLHTNVRGSVYSYTGM